MSFKYINPGYAELLDVAGGTTMTDAQKSKTGVSFWQPTRDKGINIAEIPTELYGKFDVYLPSGTGLDVNVYITFCGYCGVNIRGYSREWTIYGYYAGTSYFSNKAQVIYDAVNTIWFNAKPGDAGDCLTIKSSLYNPLNGVALYQLTANEGVVLSDKLLKIYGRFDVYIPAPDSNTEENSAINVGCYNADGFHGIRIIRGGYVLRSAVIFFYCANEGFSIIENAARIGLPVPDKLTEVMRQLKNK